MIGTGSGAGALGSMNGVRHSPSTGSRASEAARGRPMTESPETTTKIVVPASQPMVALLGPGDAHLRTVERAFPQVEVHVRGNEITLTGHPGEVALLERLLGELTAVLRTGQALSSDAVERAVGILRTESG